MISVDGSLFIQIINFLFLIWVLNTVLYRPIRNMLQQRKNKVSGLQEDIDSFSQTAREKDEAYYAGVKAARAKGLKEKEKQVQAAEEEEREIIAKINEKAHAELEKVRQKIRTDAEEVKETLLQEVDRFANDIGEKILGRAVS